MLTAKSLGISEETVVGCAIIYNSGRWTDVLQRDDLDYEYNRYLEGYVSTVVEDFCLDMMSNRIPRNKLMTALNKLNDKAKTQRFTKGKK
jgi:hypothetical protein